MMRVKKFSPYAKLALLIPYIVIISLDEIVSSTQIKTNISDVLWYCIFGRLSEGDIYTMVLSMKTISCILIFMLLYGNYVSEYFSDIANVYFVRVMSRKVWTIRKIVELGFFAMLYVAVFIVIEVYICSLRVEKMVFSQALLETAVIIGVILVPVLIVLTVLVNGLGIRWGSSISMIAVALLTVGLEVIAILTFDNRINVILNPLCFNVFLKEDNHAVLYKVIANFLYVGVISTGVVIFINHLDIWGKEK